MENDRFIYFNPNREGKHVDDCVVRALCGILQLDWDEAFLRLNMLAFEMADMPSSNEVWGRFLNLYGYIQVPIFLYYTINDFCEDHPYGKYVVCTGEHAVAIIDGHYYDTMDTGNRNVIFYYEKGSYV